MIAAIRRAGLEPELRYLHQGLSEQEAFANEIRWIAHYGRRPDGPLTNLSDGGEGQSGFKPAPETCAKIANSMGGTKNHFYGKHHSKAALAKIGSVNKGKRLSKAWRKKLSVALKGKQKSSEHCRRISRALKGKKRTKAHAQHLAEANRGKTLSAATRNKLSMALTGRQKSKTTRRRMSVGMSQSWAKRKGKT